MEWVKELEARLKQFKGYIEGLVRKVEEKFGERLDIMEKAVAGLTEQFRAVRQGGVPLPYSKSVSMGANEPTIVGSAMAWKSMTDPHDPHHHDPAAQWGDVNTNYVKSMRTRTADGQVAGDGSSGGVLVPDEIAREVTELTLANMPIMGLGPTVFRDLRGNLSLPKLLSRATAYMVSENEAPQVSQSSFGEADFRPKKTATFCKQSKRLIYQAPEVAERLVRQSIGESLGIKMEEMFVNGIGASKEPLGILNATGMTPGFSVGGRFKFDHLRRAIRNLAEVDELRGNPTLGFLCRPAVKFGLKGQTVAQVSAQAAADGALLTDSLMISDETIQKAYNVKVGDTTLMPFSSGTLTDVIVGNFEQLLIGFWRGLNIMTSDVASDGSGGSAFLQDQIYIVGMVEFDCHIARASAFTKITNVETNEANW